MQTLSHNVLGLDVNFRADADPVRVEKACALLEERHRRLTEQGRILSKEKLLTFIALSLADDLVILQEEKVASDLRIAKLLEGIDSLV